MDSPWTSQVSAHLQEASQPLLAVLGPTASGKTAFSVDLARSIAESTAAHGWRGAEIINADSRQLYRFLDIGTAKITVEEMRGIPHHLFGVLDPTEEVTISWYKEKAQSVIADVLSRKHVPMLVGGSMLYVSAVVDGLEPLPAADPQLRARLREEYERDDGKTLHARLQREDPDSAKTFHPRNKHSIIRAVEILETTGKRPSEAKTRTASPYDVLAFLLEWPRETLRKRIDARTHVLLESGWIDETWRLLARGFTREDPGMKSHGYRDIIDAIVLEAQKRGVSIAGEPPLSV